MPEHAPARSIAVIGAGAAGLVTARELLRAGLRPTVFEADDDVGGIWRYTDRTEADPLGQVGAHIHSSLYASLRTNLPRDLMAFVDFPFDNSGGGADNLPRFPGHAIVHTYLQRFAARFELLPYVRFGTQVLSVRPTDDAPMGWHVTTARGDAHETQRFDAVAVCIGHYSAPRIPALPGADSFPGLRMHSHNYREPGPFRGLTVALWGTSASGTDLAREISGVARRVYWCGEGASMASAAITRTDPDAVLQRRGEVASFAGDGCLRLVDGSHTDRIDVFVYCTGYHFRYAFLDDDLIRVDDNLVQPLYRDLLHCEYDSLALVGVPFRVVPFPLFEVQAKWLAQLWAGRFAAPPSVTRFAALRAQSSEFRAKGTQQRLWHQRTLDCYDYLDALADEASVARVPHWHRALNRLFMAHVAQTQAVYRDTPFPGCGPTRVA